MELINSQNKGIFPTRTKEFGEESAQPTHPVHRVVLLTWFRSPFFIVVIVAIVDVAIVVPFN